MKKFTLSFLLAASVCAVSAQNLVSISDFDGDMTGYLTTDTKNPEGCADLSLLRVAHFDSIQTEVANPTVAARVDVIKGMWFRQSLNSGYIKVCLMPGAFGTIGNAAYIGCAQNCGTAGLDEHFKMGIFQKITAPIDVTHKHKVTFTAKIDDLVNATQGNTCDEVAVMLRDNVTKKEVIEYVPLNSANFESYTCTFNFPEGFTGDDVLIAFSIKSSYGLGDDMTRTFRTGALIDDVELVATTEPAGLENAQIVVAKAFGEAGNIRVATEAGSTISVFNVSGQLVETVVATSNEVNVAANAGAYIVTMDGAAQKVLVK